MRRPGRNTNQCSEGPGPFTWHSMFWPLQLPTIFRFALMKLVDSCLSTVLSYFRVVVRSSHCCKLSTRCSVSTPSNWVLSSPYVEQPLFSPLAEMETCGGKFPFHISLLQHKLLPICSYRAISTADTNFCYYAKYSLPLISCGTLE